MEDKTEIKPYVPGKLFRVELEKGLYDRFSGYLANRSGYNQFKRNTLLTRAGAVELVLLDASVSLWLSFGECINPDRIDSISDILTNSAGLFALGLVGITAYTLVSGATELLIRGYRGETTISSKEMKVFGDSDNVVDTYIEKLPPNKQPELSDVLNATEQRRREPTVVDVIL